MRIHRNIFMKVRILNFYYCKYKDKDSGQTYLYYHFQFFDSENSEECN